jgi:hypothetical protein
MKKNTVGNCVPFNVAQQKRKDSTIDQLRKVSKKLKKKQAIDGFICCSKCGKEILYKERKNCYNCRHLEQDKVLDKMFSKKEIPNEAMLRKQVERQARELIREINSLKTEITDSKDKILTFDYDTETSCIEDKRG